MRLQDLKGQRFGRLTVESQSPNGASGRCRWATATEQNRNRRPRRTRAEVFAARERVAASLHVSNATENV